MAPDNLVQPTAAPDPAPAQSRMQRLQQTLVDAGNSVKARLTPTPTPPAPTLTQRAYAAGKQFAEQGVTGLAKNAVAGAENAANTRVGRYGTAAGAALQTGDHFDAFNSDDGYGFGAGNNTGLTPVEKAQILLRDAGVVAGGTAGAIVGGTGGAAIGSAVPVAGTLAGGIAGGVAGGIAGAAGVDTGMGHVRRGLNWANEKLGGAPNYWESADDLVRKSRDFQQAQPGYQEGEIQRGARATNRVIGSLLEKTGLISRPSQPSLSADAQEDMRDKRMAENLAGGATAAPRDFDKEVAAAVAKSADAAGPAAPSTINTDAAMKGTADRRTIRTSNGDVNTGRDARGQLVVTAGLDDSAADAETKRAAEAERMTKDLARQKAYFEGEAIKSDMASNNPADVQRGIRAQLAALQTRQADLDASTKGEELRLKGLEVGNHAKQLELQTDTQRRASLQQASENRRKAVEDADKDRTQWSKSLDDAFVDPADTSKVDRASKADYMRQAEHTVAQLGRRNPKGGFWNPTANEPVGVASLDQTQQDRLINRYKAVQAVKASQKGMLFGGEKADSLDLSDFDGIDGGDHIEFPKLSKKYGRKITVPKRDIDTNEGPRFPLNPGVGRTPNSTHMQSLLDNLEGK